MSRIIVKNLPKNIKEEKFRSLFASKGEITDLRLCKTKDGVFRRFGFVGFKTEEQAENAIKFFNNSYIDTTKIQVEVARDLGEKSARPWSKYSEGSSAFQKRLAKLEEKKKAKESKSSENDTESDVKNTKKRDKKLKGMDEMEENREFKEFLAAHQSRSKKLLWSNEISGKDIGSAEMDASSNENSTKKNGKLTEVLSEESKDDNSSDHSESGKESEIKTSASATNLSDMDYLRSKMVAKSDDNQPDSSADETDSEDDGDGDGDGGGGGSSSDSSDEKISKDTFQSNQKVREKQHLQISWTLKMRGLPFKLKEKEIKDFFSPVECVDIRFVNNKKGQRSGRAFVDFKSEKDLKKALKRDKDYLKGRYIELFRDDGNDNRQGDKQREEDEKPWMKKLKEKENEDNEEDETIGESGRLFLRNLSYTCTEDDIQKLFEKHGLLSEVNLPLDKQTHKTIGIGYVTFLMPEHAVKAFNELDGKVFQGRLLHILPSKAKKAENEMTGDTTYKKKNEAKKKSQSSSDHNWNTLFLGVNAVADAMADKYNTTKRGILDAESSSSLAVRMALGETQVVADTRKFLIDHGVKLDVFGQPTSHRSKTVVIAKNLPYGTRSEELTMLFSPFGQLGRVVLPPTGITALIEFNEPSIARKAFQKLAYTKFKNSLLYLEWAPVDVFVEGSETKTSEIQMKAADKDKETKQEELSGEESEGEDSEGKILFVKNLNFETTEETLKEKFSHAGAVKSVTIAIKKDSKNQGALLSMGYGFVEFKEKSSALKAMKDLQNCMVDNHALELKISHRKSNDQVVKRQRNTTSKQKSSKILVRNVAFEANTKEIRELFSTFGEIKTLRLPKKMVGTGPHRGFAFVDFLTKQDAKRAFESLSTSTHLYGRRLVLEWAQDDDDVDTLRKRTAEHFHGEPKKKKKKQAIVDELLEMTDEAES